jgi:hypothetical protein
MYETLPGRRSDAPRAPAHRGVAGVH